MLSSYQFQTKRYVVCSTPCGVYSLLPPHMDSSWGESTLRVFFHRPCIEYMQLALLGVLWLLLLCISSVLLQV